MTGHTVSQERALDQIRGRLITGEGTAAQYKVPSPVILCALSCDQAPSPVILCALSCDQVAAKLHVPSPVILCALSCDQAPSLVKLCAL